MTVCEKVPEMLLIIGPAIILGRHRGVSEPIITKRMKTVRNTKASPSPAPCPHAHPPARTRGPRGNRFHTPAWALSLLFLLLAPIFINYFHPLLPLSIPYMFIEHLLYAAGAAGNKTDMVAAQESSFQ